MGGVGCVADLYSPAAPFHLDGLIKMCGSGVMNIIYQKNINVANYYYYFVFGVL